MAALINITVEDKDGTQRNVQVPTDMALNLMEVLKGEEYPILATCGGMALCATCHVQVLQQGVGSLPAPQDDELMMLDTLPYLTDTSRLSCQIQIQDALDGAVIRVLGEDQ